ncbi:Eco57I restriction-modification methylase domain-containing protein [Oscillospiraceae bacterium OttesenSCG-928-F05]|nr:Eco57I restriction-modification methylase domain-containing protein [Oscillospiraceae bacterium OttesenSCG-928-F05]
MFKNIEILNRIIVGRVEPYIYAFSTDTIPNYLKIGDTYRPVSVRLNEWKKHFPTLREAYRGKAIINDAVFFRDYSVHQYLEKELSKERLMPDDIRDIYYSNEFFKDTNVADIEAAIEDIKHNFETHIDKYQYYNSKTRLPETHAYASTGKWALRPNQQAAVDNFKNAIESGRKNLLMYAVMRFGKSFTSLCCAKEMGAKLVLVVSAKADVREEWKKTVQQADNFNKDYIFISGEDLSRDRDIIKSTLNADKRVVIFLTLQDLQGETIKDKHNEIFGNMIDLLVVDETHYGARAEKYGQVLRDNHYTEDVKQKYSDEDFIDVNEADRAIKALDAHIKLHLSGTPYRILMGSEFKKEDIIAFYQFSDIVAEQERWDSEHILDDDVKEWENPYYGFPQMIRFAFNPSKLAQSKLAALRANGNTYAFSALLRPKSVKKASDHSHQTFIYQDEVLELFSAIDGCKEDSALLGFLNYDKIKEGNMCRHMVCVLPYCASCDALEKLLTDHKDQFLNLNDYTIINISGVDKASAYKSVNAVKEKIAKCEEENKKTLTLTVNRMLTGSTVEQWDTMLFLKDTASPQEYDQAIFRLQNQYIKTFVNTSGETIKFNMKPQTLLVDFDPHRMFSMQEQKSLIYNANTEEIGNQRLEERMRAELQISPIIAINKNKIVQVEPADILNAISAYSSAKSVIDEAREIPVDFSLLKIDEIKNTISLQAELGSKKGLQLEAHDREDEGNDLDAPGDAESEAEGDLDSNTGHREEPAEPERQQLEDQFRMYYSRLLFYSFLSNDKLRSLDDLLDSLDSADNARIAANLSLDKTVLHVIRDHINLFVLSSLDYKIQNINALARDESIEPEERSIRAINKFGKLSESEVPTPLNIATDMINLFSDDHFYRLAGEKTVLLDIASKIGEFAIAICKRLRHLGIDPAAVKSKIMAVPTSAVAYEFTRKIYTVLGLDIDCIATTFTSYDFLNVTVVDDEGNATDEIDYKKITRILRQHKKLSKITLEDKAEEGDEVKFEAIVGNPPYQISDGGAQASARPIYHHFVNIAKALKPTKLTMITPSRWYAGGKGLGNFRNSMLNDRHIERLDDFLHPEEIFPGTNNRGGICYFLWNSKYDNLNSEVTVVSHNGNSEITFSKRGMKTKDLDIFIRDNIGIEILSKVIPGEGVDVMSNYVSPRKPFGIESNIVKTKRWKKKRPKSGKFVLCYGRGKQTGFIDSSEPTLHKEWIDVWKVYTPRANNVGTELSDDNLNTFVGKPNSICTEAYIVIGAELKLDRKSAMNLSRYFKTKFARFMHSILKASHDASRKTYQFVPVQNFTSSSDIDWEKSIGEIDAQLYAKYGLSQKEQEHIERKIKPMA